jgi:hypothetical protein
VSSYDLGACSGGEQCGKVLRVMEEMSIRHSRHWITMSARKTST